MKLTTLLGSLLLTSCASVAASVPPVAPLAGPVVQHAADSTALPDDSVTASVELPAAPANRVLVLFGQRSLDKGEWSPLEDQPAFAVEFAHEPEGSAIGWEVGFAGSRDDDDVLGIDVDLTTSELYGGVVKSFPSSSSKLRPYIGGGLSFITADVDVTIASDDDSSIAFYLHGGAAFNLTPAFSLGLDLRLLFGSDLTIGGVDTDVDYEQLMFFAGWSF